MISFSRRSGARLQPSILVGLILVLVLSPIARAQGTATGTVVGRVIDEGSGFGVSWATVTVVQTGQSASSDLSGGYAISGVDAGVVTLLVEKEGFQTANITDVNVLAGETLRMDIPLGAVGGNVVVMDAFTISADVVQSSDIGLLAARQKANSISDAIGSDQFSRLGAGNAAEALGKVTGASVVDGKYVLIRGLGDRYSNTLMNGVSVPSADPDKRAVQMDQFPTEMIESVVTTKSFTPDQPGAFSGGSVNLKTKSFPENFFVSVSGSVGANSNTRGDQMLSSPGNTGPAPDVPQEIPNRDLAEIEAEFFGNFDPAHEVDAATRAFGPAGLYPTVRNGGVDLGYSFAIGQRIEYSDEGLIGITGSFNQSRSYSHYDGGEIGRYTGTAANANASLLFSDNPDTLSFDPADAPSGTPQFGLSSSTLTESTGGLVKLAIRPSIDHEVSLDLIYNETVDDGVRRGVGEEVRNYGGAIYEVYELLRTERSVSSAQLAGKSLFMGLNETEIEWRLSSSRSGQDQPDYRTMATIYDLNGDPVNATGVQPNRYFRELDEEATEGGIDITIPFAANDRSHRFKFGGMASANERTYDEQRFRYAVVPRNRTQLTAFPGPVGILAEDANGVTFGNTISRQQEPNKYDATQDVSAAYAMVDFQITDDIRAIIGGRYESTEIVTTPVAIPGLNPKTGEVDDSNFLPAASFVYAQNKKMNWRAAYGRTIARPTYKELTDIRYDDVFTGDTYVGNTDLELTVIDNFDLRWEWFPQKGETVAVSVFYKSMSNPIEVLYQPAVGSIRPQNVEEGTVSGIELEFRRDLDFLSEALSRWSIGGNLTFIESEVTIPDDELAILRAADANASNKRELLGQSPYVFNADVNYSREEWGTSATLSYNIVGERLDLVVFGSLPDVYEQPAPSLNFVLSQSLGYRWKMKFSAKNLLNPDREKLIDLASGPLVYSRYQSGRSLSLSFSYLFE
ncbi:TonB-dependent receptor [Synoicihabitans lomoniglobus]|uniref:TonB-dependent receptor n=1 Tax=Synoicihabitans lomoniglobus TaxID=2909285 RepID=A0AAF0CQC9_9BACT|nr:TonB-dependent receptor [Opitutaceae bacterium LMO-M01]WED66109.1 TonB-dependent receptor [Opitutaceae bacterium LMO-M01]